MALLWFDSCGDGYTWSAAAPLQADIDKFWSGATCSGGGTNLFPAPATGRNGNGIQLSNGNVEIVIWKTLSTSATKLFTGWAWRKNGGYSGNTPIWKVADSSGNVQASLYHDGSNFYFYRGDGTTLLATYANALSTATWYYFEVQWYGDQTNGYLEFRINESVVLTYTGDTCQQASTSAQRIYFGGDRTQTGTTIIDDVYVCDDTGSAPTNTYLGDTKVEVLYPSGAGNTDGAGTSFDGSDGNQTSNWLLVDETAQDGDTTYVQSADSGDKDTYAYDSLATASGSAYAVKLCTFAEKTDAGSKTFVNVTRLSGTEVDSSALSPSNASYNNHESFLTTKPGGGTWSISDVNNAEFGFKVS